MTDMGHAWGTITVIMAIYLRFCLRLKSGRSADRTRPCPPSDRREHEPLVAAIPLACAAALATSETIEVDGLVQRAQKIEAIMLRRRLRSLQATDRRIGDVRGRGAMIAVELVEAGTNVPDPTLARAVTTAAHQEGVIVLTCGTYGNVLRFLPPLTISDALLVEALGVVENALTGSR